MYTTYLTHLILFIIITLMLFGEDITLMQFSKTFY
jgi:hypothetical protein